MIQDHIEVLTELGTRKYPLDIRLRAGELLSLVLAHHLEDKEVPLPTTVQYVTGNLTREYSRPPT